MKILLVHAYYRERGGEDVVFESERDLLKRYGHHVITFVRSNEEMEKRPAVANGLEMVWSGTTYRALLALLKREKPDVVHFHNTFPVISPAAYYACRDAGIPIVQTLHNYRLICPGALLMRNGVVCDDCVGKIFPWPGVLYGCWRGSMLGTGSVAVMLTVHRFLNTWRELVDRYIVLSEFARHKFISGGIPSSRIVVKPNFVYPDPGTGKHDGGYVLFVGRLSPEKGIKTLLQAWLFLRDVPLRIVGDGELRNSVEQFVARNQLSNISIEGQLSRKQVFERMHHAILLVVPSDVPETFGMTVVESFSSGLPVIATPMGALTELIDDGRTGLFFQTGDADMLAGKIRWALKNPAALHQMGVEARREYRKKYTAESNYQVLLSIYKSLLESAQNGS